MEKIFLVHGWSVTDTSTYNSLHKKLGKHGFDIENIFLGRYVSLDDQVEIIDLAKGLDEALVSEMKDTDQRSFHFITHSTGALIVKEWIQRFYPKRRMDWELKNAVFLAGPHFGSRLAHHGRSMIAQVKQLGSTGKKVLNALELGSNFAWENNFKFTDRSTWQGIRMFCLIGDRVETDFFVRKIFPASAEKGSDEVVRVAAGNLNFKRFAINGATGTIELIAELKGIAFGTLGNYTHSGDEYGIMNSITENTTRDNHQSFGLILDCLNVKTDAEYETVTRRLASETEITKKGKKNGEKAFAQLVFKFSDEYGLPVTDYVFKLGVLVNGEYLPSNTVVHTHKNEVDPNFFTAYIDLSELETDYQYFLEFDSNTGTELYSFHPDPLKMIFVGLDAQHTIEEHETIQFDVVLGRRSSRNIFVFHKGTDPTLHVRWDRSGNLTDLNI